MDESFFFGCLQNLHVNHGSSRFMCDMKLIECFFGQFVRFCSRMFNLDLICLSLFRV